MFFLITIQNTKDNSKIAGGGCDDLPRNNKTVNSELQKYFVVSVGSTTALLSLRAT